MATACLAMIGGSLWATTTLNLAPAPWAAPAPPVPAKPTIDPITNQPAAGSTVTVTIHSDTTWTASSDVPWATVEAPTTGNKNGSVTVTFAANTGTTERTATIKVTTADASVFQTVAIKQLAPAVVAVTGVTLDKSNETLTAGGVTLTLTASIVPTGATNQNVTWESTDLAIASVAAGPGLTATVTPLAAGTATIKVKTVDGNHEATCNVTVNAAAPTPSITLSKTQIDTTADAATVAISVNANVAWTATPSAGASWVTVAPTSGTGTGSENATITLTKNETGAVRNANVTFTAGTATQTVAIKQAAAAAAPTLTVTPTSVDVDEKAYTKTIEIKSNATWKAEVEAGKPWVKVATADATGTSDKTITLNIDANTSAARTAKLTIKTTTGTGGDVTAEITINQSGTGPTLALDTAALMGTQPFTGANRVVKVKSNSLWVATSGAEWIRILDGQGGEQSTRPGGNDQDITVRIKPNTTNAPRTATITFKTNREGVTNITKTVTVTQAASSFSCSITGLADPVDAAGAQATVTLNSTTSYAISTRGTDWLKIQDGTQPEKDSIGFSSSQHSLYLLVKGNDGGIRTGYLRIYSNGVLVETRKITQAGNNISAQLVTPGNIPVGGGTKDVKVSSPTSWEILITGDWLVVDKKKKVESSVNDTLITFRAKDKNPGLTARTATVTFQTKRGQGKTSITLTQDGSFSMIYDKSQFEKVSQKGAQRLTVVVKSEKPWKPSVVEIPATKSGPQLRAKVVEKDTTLSWLSISYERENATHNDGEMKIDVKPNTGTTSREAKILLTLTDGTPLDTIVLRQFNAEGKLTPHGTTTPVTALKFSKTSVSININKAKTLQLSVTVVPDNASNKTVLWSSSDTSIAKVDTKGLVTVQKEGKAIITATAADGSGVKATCEVNVLTTDANAALEGLKIYATAGQLHLSLPAAHDVRIYTLTGALVRTLTAPAGDTTLALPAGLYIVRAGNAVQKVIVE